MDLFSITERAMAMSPQAWARHANPVSGWSRLWSALLILPALWSPFWIGWWSLVPIASVIAWILLNPRLFPPPETADAWMTKGVLGERVFLNRKKTPVPPGYVRAGWITTGISLVFVGLVVLGFLRREFWLAMTAWCGASVAKIWFVDRMARLFELMQDATPQYRAWSRAEWN